MDRVNQMVEQDIILPAQYYGVLESRTHYTPEHKLLYGILCRAINDYLRGRDYDRAKAERWFVSNSTHFTSFKNIVRLLNLEPSCLWPKLQAKRKLGVRSRAVSEEHLIP